MKAVCDGLEIIRQMSAHLFSLELQHLSNISLPDTWCICFIFTCNINRYEWIIVLQLLNVLLLKGILLNFLETYAYFNWCFSSSFMQLTQEKNLLQISMIRPGIYELMPS